MSITSSLTLSLVSGDGSTGGTNNVKPVTGLSYAARMAYSDQPTIGVDAPSAPLPTSKLAVPGTVTPSTSASGGTLAAATYYYVVTALNAAGETTGSTEVSQTTTGATSSNTLSWTLIASAASYRVYRGTSAGNETVYFSTSTGSFVDIGAVGTAGTVPSSNTTGTSGSVAAGTYYVKISYLSAPQGESLASAESAQLTCLASSAIVIPSPTAQNASFYNVYITAANGSSGTETKQNASPIPIGTTYTQTAAISSGTALPAQNTTLVYMPSLTDTPLQMLYVRNVSTLFATQLATVTWTPYNGSSNKVLDLVPQAALLFLEPTAGSTQGGISAFSITVAQSQTKLDMAGAA